MKVYVIEDNPVYNDYVCNLLKKEGFDTMQHTIFQPQGNCWQKRKMMTSCLQTYACSTVRVSTCYAGCVPMANGNLSL